MAKRCARAPNDTLLQADGGVSLRVFISGRAPLAPPISWGPLADTLARRAWLRWLAGWRLARAPWPGAHRR